ncbi:hypothetical protein B9479_007181 [Cryptococcus floricola]|uniref:Uncharacterized protein n=1 Tax=Cryptococcus floricola TaxID=2591691 RepID=A0A5D3AN48_9TREE|nr:hypothetical protein B9479_007181 [Cryptococcus floricola]
MSNHLTATDPFAGAYNLDDFSDTSNEQTGTPATPLRRSPRGHQRSSDVAVERLGTSSAQQADVFDYTRNHKTYQSLSEERQEQAKMFCQFDLRRQLLELHLLMLHAFAQRDEADQRAEEARRLKKTVAQRRRKSQALSSGEEAAEGPAAKGARSSQGGRSGQAARREGKQGE